MACVWDSTRLRACLLRLGLLDKYYLTPAERKHAKSLVKADLLAHLAQLEVEAHTSLRMTTFFAGNVKGTSSEEKNSVDETAKRQKVE